MIDLDEIKALLDEASVRYSVDQNAEGITLAVTSKLKLCVLYRGKVMPTHSKPNPGGYRTIRFDRQGNYLSQGN